MKKFCLRLKGSSECFFLVFAIFIFPNFKWLLSKILKKNHPFLFSENSMEIHFVYLFFVNERNITTSLLMISLKLTVVHYANVSSSSINKSNLRAAEYGISFLFVFFISFLFMFILTRLLSKTLWQNYHSLIQIHKMYFKM